MIGSNGMYIYGGEDKLDITYFLAPLYFRTLEIFSSSK
jgi:hypothetical protein